MRLFLAALLCVFTASLFAQGNTLLLKDIQFSGNRKTKKYILERELVVSLGELYSDSSLNALAERSRQNLMNTALFNFVELTRIDSGNQITLSYRFTERWYTFPSPIFELIDPNFNTWYQTRDLNRINYGLQLTQFNVRGANETIRARAKFGYNQQFSLNYDIPYIDKRKKLGIAFFASFQESDQVAIASADNKRVFFTVRGGKVREEIAFSARVQYRKATFGRHFFSLGYAQASVSDSLAALASNYLLNGVAKAKWLGFEYQFYYDKRDYVPYPLKGELYNLSVTKPDIALANTPQSPNFILYAQLKKYVPLTKVFYLAASLSTKFNTNTKQAYYFQQGLGYSDFVRGYEYYVIDAQCYAILKTSYKMRLLKQHSYRLFKTEKERFSRISFASYINLNFDLAYAKDVLYNEQNFLANNWLYGGGVGVDLISFYDIVIRGEYSINKRGEDGFFLHFSKPI